MPGNLRLLPKAEVVAPRLARAEFAPRPKSSANRVLRFPAIQLDRQERRLQGRARRQALALMVGSSLIMILILYGVFVVFRGVIAGLS